MARKRVHRPHNNIRTVGVYCGSARGLDPACAEVAGQLGNLLAMAGWAVVYGGGGVGLMGVLADALLAAGGRVVGVRPHSIFPGEPPHPGVTDMREVGTLSERKRVMYDLADAIIVLPGGWGTLDELCDALAMAQCAPQRKVIVLVNVAGFWSPFLTFVRHASEAGFLPIRDLGLLRTTETAEGAIATLLAG